MAQTDTLQSNELYWRDHYEWLLGQGYRLRSRYKPDWVPSWSSRVQKMDAEDSLNFRHMSVIDAIEVASGQHVVLKRTSRTDNPDEVRILEYFSQEDLANDPRNHCPPLKATLQPPDDLGHDICVIPILRQYDDPPFDTVGEALDFIHQTLEGFAFLHEHRVAHRDVKADNVLVDPVALGFPDFHFARPKALINDINAPANAKFTRTERRPKYYITDFGFSSQYSADAEPWPPMEPPKPASDASLPEFQMQGLFDPFPVDVYYVGNWIKIEFVDGDRENPLRPGYENSFEFLRPLVESMTTTLPAERITMAEAVKKFEEIVSGLSATLWSTWKLRAAPQTREAPPPADVRLLRGAKHLARRFKYVALGRPAIPTGTRYWPSVPPKESTASEQEPSQAEGIAEPSQGVAPEPHNIPLPSSPMSATGPSSGQS